MLVFAARHPAPAFGEFDKDIDPRLRSTNAAEIDNLRAFAGLYGYVRYFHPSDAASTVDWDRFAILGVRRVKVAESQEDLRQTLNELFQPIAPTLQIYAEGESVPPLDPTLQPDDTNDLEVVAWQHSGFGHEGSRGPYMSIRLNRMAKVPISGPGFGTIVQNVAAGPYRGWQVKLEASVKAEVSGGGNQGQLWLRVDRVNNQRGFFNNMADRPVIDAEWNRYEIVGQVAEDAERIFFGGFLLGMGKIWLDDFELFVRESDEDEWRSVALANPGFEEDSGGEGFPGWNSASPGYQYNTTGEAPFAGDRSAMIESAASPESPARPLFDKHASVGDVTERPLGSGLIVRMPLALYSRDGQTLRPAGAPSLATLNSQLEETSPGELSAEDEAFRYADVVIAWNIFQHFYPYFDVIETDWDDVLTRTFLRAKDDRTTEDFLLTLRWMVAQLEDGHGGVYHAVESSQAGLPLLVEYIEGNVVVAATTDGGEGTLCFSRGDIVTAVDGVPSDQALEEAKSYISGTPQWKTYRALSSFGRGQRGTQAHLSLDRAGQTITCDVTRDFEGQLSEARPAPIDMLEEGIFYVDLGRAEIGAIQAEIEALAQAEGVIFDLRGYPNGNHAVLSHLSEDPLQSAHWQVPQLIYPDRIDPVGYDTTGRWTLPPATPQFTGKIIFLTDGRAISYAESVMGIVEHYRLGEIVGQPTAGANGNINPFVIPGGYRLVWTGMRVIKHDGSQHHLIGIQPTVRLERSVQGVREGRDEYLEKALEIIKNS